jgi:hypothetical protein
MGLPLTYKGELKWPEPQPDPDNQPDIDPAGSKYPTTQTTNITDLAGLKLAIKVQYNYTNGWVVCNYTVKIFPVFLISITGILLAMLFFVTYQPNYAVVALIVSVLYYVLNLAYIHQKTIRALHAPTTYNTDTLLWQQQQQWLNQPGYCPACGEPENKYTEFCTNCGLRIAHKKMDITNTSTTGQQSIVYSRKPHA